MLNRLICFYSSEGSNVTVSIRACGSNRGNGNFASDVPAVLAIIIPRIAPVATFSIILIRSLSKVGSQEIPGETSKLDLGVHSEAEQRLTEFCQENTLVIENTLLKQHKR